MKPARISALCAAGLLALALTGCGAGPADTQATYIGIDAAKAVALTSAGVAEGDAQFSTAGLDRRNGMDFYAVDFTASGLSYEYDIDAITGMVIDTSTSAAAASPASGAAEPPAAATLSPPAASPVTAPPASSPPAAGQPVTGQTAAGQASTGITEDQAREIALNHAGLAADQVSFIHTKPDWEDGRRVYDVEFYSADYTEYDYEIDADTGDIRSYDYDAEGFHYQPSGSASITPDQAKGIALAQVPGASTSHIYQFETDWDDGRIEYEGKIIYNDAEYEFTIDAYSGAIRGWEVESFYW